MMHTDEAAAIRAYLGPLLTGETCPALLRQIPIAFLDQVWPHVSAWIAERVVERSRGAMSLDGIAEKLLTGQWQLWVVYDGSYRAVLATEVTKEGIARIHFATGRGAEGWKHLIGDLEAWARDQGCTRLEMLARKGWAKHLPDFKMTHVLLEKDLA